jgi:uncharacterized alkaline shock family protein YloU
MKEEKNPYGNIHVTPRAVATIAHRAVIETYGVVGLASKNLITGLTNLLVKDPAHGIEVNYADELINIDVYVIVEYGTNIKSVADSLASTVRFHVEKALGLPIHQVNVHIQGMRISEA